MSKKNKKRQHNFSHQKKTKEVAPFHNLASLNHMLQQALTLHQAGRLSEARTIYNQILLSEPNHFDALHLLGVIAHQEDEYDIAVELIQKALKSVPDFAPAYSNLGAALKDQGKLDEAVASYRQAIALSPDNAEAHNNLGVLLSELGKLDEAIVCYKMAISLKPDYAAAYNHLSAIMKYTETDDVIKVMEYLYKKKADISDAERINLGFALGKIFEDLGDFDKSFNYILEANQLKRKLFNYSIQNDQDLFERIKKTFSPDFFALHHSSGNPDSTPIFILGMPRSGTTLVEQILASHPMVFGAGELTVLKELTDVICSGGRAAKFPECLKGLDNGAFERAGAYYIEKIRENSRVADYITDKMPHNFLFVGFIKIILPNAKIIHCIRDPMDNCFSIFKNDFTKTPGYAYDMIEIGRHYNLYRNLMAHWEKVLPGYVYSLKYEEIVSDQKNQTRKLLDFCGLPWDEACLEFYKKERRVSTLSLAQVRQPIYKDSVGLWKRYEKQLEPLRKIIYG